MVLLVWFPELDPQQWMWDIHKLNHLMFVGRFLMQHFFLPGLVPRQCNTLVVPVTHILHTHTHIYIHTHNFLYIQADQF